MSGRLYLGVANYLTVLRLVLTPAVVLLLLSQRLYPALAFYFFLAASDVADGVIARRRGEESQLGAILDPLADIVSNFAVYASFYAMGLVPAWVLAILVVRYVSLIAGIAALRAWFQPLRIKATPTGKIVGVLQALVAILIVVLTAEGVAWQETWGQVLYPFLGTIFGSVIVSQLVIAVRHVRTTTAHVRPRGQPEDLPTDLGHADAQHRQRNR